MTQPWGVPPGPPVKLSPYWGANLGSEVTWPHLNLLLQSVAPHSSAPSATNKAHSWSGPPIMVPGIIHTRANFLCRAGRLSGTQNMTSHDKESVGAVFRKASAHEDSGMNSFTSPTVCSTKMRRIYCDGFIA